MDFASCDGHDAVTIRPKPNIPLQHIEIHFTAEDDADGAQLADLVAAATDYGAGAFIEPGYITHVDNEALAALNLPWDQIGVTLPDQRLTTGFPAKIAAIPALASRAARRNVS